MTIVYRIQDDEGRGPWKPGFSHLWIEPRADHDNLIPWYREFGDVHLRAIAGMYMGCACTSVDQLRRWFSPVEYDRLISFGYRAVTMKAGRILAQSDIQCFFERSKPLRKQVCEFDLYEIGKELAA